jgi:hypothetical protein
VGNSLELLLDIWFYKDYNGSMINIQEILKKLNEQTIMLSEVSSELSKISQSLIDNFAKDEYDLPSELVNDGKD